MSGAICLIIIRVKRPITKARSRASCVYVPYYTICIGPLAVYVQMTKTFGGRKVGGISPPRSKGAASISGACASKPQFCAAESRIAIAYHKSTLLYIFYVIYLYEIYYRRKVHVCTIGSLCLVLKSNLKKKKQIK